MKKTIYSKWHVKLAIILFCIAVIFLAVYAFKSGVFEAAAYKHASEQGPSK